MMLSCIFLIDRGSSCPLSLQVLPQLCSRICHTNKLVYAQIEALLVKLLLQHEQQTLWMLIGVYKSTQQERRTRCKNLFDKARRKRARLAEHIESLCDLADQLCIVCNKSVRGDFVSFLFFLSFSRHVLNYIVPLDVGGCQGLGA